MRNECNVRAVRRESYGRFVVPTVTFSAENLGYECGGVMRG